MSVKLALNIIKSNDGQSFVPNNLAISPTITVPSIIRSEGELYEKFIQFMMNADNVRYGIHERVGAKKLAISFNNTMQENISFNHAFPKLMAKFIIDYPQYGIVKKTMTEGVTYIRIGLSRDPEPKAHYPLTMKEKNDKSRAQKQEILKDLMNNICERKGWTHTQYQQMVDLKLVKAVKFNKVINIEATIRVSEGLLIGYIHDVLNRLTIVTKYAYTVRDDFLRATQTDNDLTPVNSADRYESRLLAAERTYDAGTKLGEEVARYNNTVAQLPVLDYIVYPNIQHLNELLTWLKQHSKYLTRLDMVKTHKEFEHMDIVNDTDDEIRLNRILDAEIFVTKLLVH